MKTIYIGIDPDLRKLNCALLIYDPPITAPLAVFLRRNKTKLTKDDAVACAVKVAEDLAKDVLQYFVQHEQYQRYTITMIAESQSMQHQRRSKRRIDPDDILRLGQIVGIIMGAFSSIVDNIHLVQPTRWKKQVPKKIHHPRIYSHLGWEPGKPPEGISKYSGDKINPGDYSDINDSIGLALYGAENKL